MLGPSPRVLPAPEEGPLGARVARLGGRVFAFGGEVLVALPGAGGAQVLVPRGFGHPLLARPVAGALRALGTGAPCHPARWVSAGGVAARVREVTLPRGPAQPLAGDEATAGEATGAWMCVRTEPIGWAAARLADPSVTHGEVALVEARVVATSAGAARAGVRRGMSAALARRKAPGLRIVRAVGTEVVEAAVVRTLAETFGTATRVGGGWLVRLREGESAVAAERTLRRLWQRAGVEAAAAVAARAEDAAGLARGLRPGQVGVVPDEAAGAWSGRGARASWWTGRAGASWRGAALPDTDGAIARARGLVAAIGTRAGAFRIVVKGERAEARVDVRVEEGCEATLRDAVLDAALRGRLVGVGAVERIRVEARPATGAPARLPREERRAAAPAPRQLALLPGVR